MKRVILIQARMGSTRLPGKVLMDVAGRPMLAQQIRRLKECTLIDEIWIATTVNRADDPIMEIAHQEGLGCFRGSEQDVLGRFVGAAHQSKADVIVRITADCPLIDPKVTDRVVKELIENSNECDYASNVVHRTYPRGLDVEAFYFDTLLRMDRLAQSQPSREHVTLFIRSERPELFLCRSIIDSEDNSDLRWTVDTEADLKLIRAIYDGLDLGGRVAFYQEILSYVRAHPELNQINANINTWDPTINKH